MDVHTLFVVLAMSHTANFLFSLALYKGGNQFPGAKLWILAQSIAALGSIGMASRETIPFWALIGANALLFASQLIYAHSVWRFRWRKTFFWPLYILPFFFAAIMLGLENKLATRAIVFATVVGLASLWVAVILVWKPRKDYRYASWMTAIPFVLISLTMAAQVTGAVLKPDFRQISDVGTYFSLVILVAILTASFSLFGYYLLAGVRRRRVMDDKNRRLRRLIRKLNRTSAHKDLFVSILAHDLRGPIAGASRYVRKHLLTPGSDPEKKREALEIIATSLEKAHKFLDNILWWSRSHRRDWARNRRQFDLGEAMAEVVASHSPLADGKEIELEFSRQPAPVFADYDTVELIMQNLVSNAIKFSYPESRVDLATGTNDKGEAWFRVTDRGIGIVPEMREKLFQIQSKVSMQGTRGETGSGMGLILCWTFATLNRARLILTSEPDMGTTVQVIFTRP